MEKRIINNDDIFDNLITIRQDKNAINNESTLFLRIKSTFDKSIFLQLAESVNWKRFSDFPLPNEASLLYDVKEELNVKKDAVGCIVDLFNDMSKKWRMNAIRDFSCKSCTFCNKKCYQRAMT